MSSHSSIADFRDKSTLGRRANSGGTLEALLRAPIDPRLPKKVQLEIEIRSLYRAYAWLQRRPGIDPRMRRQVLDRIAKFIPRIRAAQALCDLLDPPPGRPPATKAPMPPIEDDREEIRRAKPEATTGPPRRHDARFYYARAAFSRCAGFFLSGSRP
jgi:hypothetical protein